MGFVRNGAVAETLLERMLKASSVEFLDSGTEKSVAFSISDSDRAELEAAAAECGAGSS